jgi:putative ABC transport system permease protein
LDGDGLEQMAVVDLTNLGVAGEIKTWQEKSEVTISEIVGSFALVNYITFAIGLVMAITIIFIVTYINTLHNKKQIGILKAIGIRQGVIVTSYVLKAIFYCIAGILFGAVLLYVMIDYFTKNPLKFPLGLVEPLVESSSIMKSLVVLFLSSLIAGFLPSWSVSKKKIVEAIWG